MSVRPHLLACVPPSGPPSRVHGALPNHTAGHLRLRARSPSRPTMRSLVSDPSSSADGSTAGDEGGGVVSRRRVGARVDADAARAAMPPPAPRPARAPRVLDEDEWTARLDAIITRDYFPDVPALRNKLEWLEAANSGDPARVLEAQRHIQRRLRDAARGAVLDTPSLANLTSAATGPTPTQSPSLRARSDHASPSPAAARDEWEDDEAPPSSTTRENRQSGDRASRRRVR